MSRSTRAARKVREAQQRSQMYSAAGPSLLQSLEDTLLKWCVKYVDEPTDVTKGVVHGLAISVAKIRLPYEDQRIIVKQVKKEFLRKSKEGHETYSAKVS